MDAIKEFEGFDDSCVYRCPVCHCVKIMFDDKMDRIDQLKWIKYHVKSHTAGVH